MTLLALATKLYSSKTAKMISSITIGDAAAEFDDSEEKIEEHIDRKGKVRFLEEMDDSSERSDMATIQVRERSKYVLPQFWKIGFMV